jgi:hypothetical protein
MDVDERAVPAPARDQPVGGQALQGGPQRRPADAELLGELGLRRQPPVGKRIRANRLQQRVAGPLGERPRLQASKRLVAWLSGMVDLAIVVSA